MSSTALDVSNVSRSFDGEEVIRDVTFDLHEGSLTALLGPNGAGKTTLLRMLSTLLSPTRGSFEVRGIPHTNPSKIRAEIGVLPESNGYYSSWTAHEYLSFFARLAGRRPEDAHTLADELLDTFGLGESGDVRLAVFSRGMHQRLGLAKTLVNDPSVVFLDEPTLGLDPSGKVALEEYIREMADDRGAAVLLSTHDLQQAEDTCDDTLILNDGELVSKERAPDAVTNADVERTVRIDVRSDSVTAARRALDDCSIVHELSVRERARFCELRATVVGSEGDGTDGRRTRDANEVIRRLVERGVPVLRFEIEETQLRDTFFELTGQ